MEQKSVVESLSALAHEARLAVFRLLMHEGPDGLPAGEIGQRLGIPANSLSFHLTRLRYAGLVAPRRNGRQNIYAANYAGMKALIGFLTESCCERSPRGCSVDCPPASSSETASGTEGNRPRQTGRSRRRRISQS